MASSSSSKPSNLGNGEHHRSHPNGERRHHPPPSQQQRNPVHPPPAGRRPYQPPQPPPPPPAVTPPPPPIHNQNHNPPPHPIPDHHNPYHRYHHYSTSSSSSASFKGCCCCLLLLLTFLALLATAVALVIILVIKPKKPEFNLQQVAVSYILITKPADPTADPLLDLQQSPPPPPAAYLTMNITMIFTASNPNKVGIRYGSPGFTVMYKGIPLGLATLPEFEQPAHSVRLVETRVAVARVNILQGDALDLLRDASLNDRVELRVAGDVAGKIRVMGITSPRVQVSVDCAVVISPRRQTVTYKQCGFDGVNV